MDERRPGRLAGAGIPAEHLTVVAAGHQQVAAAAAAQDRHGPDRRGVPVGIQAPDPPQARGVPDLDGVVPDGCGQHGLASGAGKREDRRDGRAPSVPACERAAGRVLACRIPQPQLPGRIPGQHAAPAGRVSQCQQPPRLAALPGGDRSEQRARGRIPDFHGAFIGRRDEPPRSSDASDWVACQAERPPGQRDHAWPEFGTRCRVPQAGRPVIASAHQKRRPARSRQNGQRPGRPRVADQGQVRRLPSEAGTTQLPGRRPGGRRQPAALAARFSVRRPLAGQPRHAELPEPFPVIRPSGQRQMRRDERADDRLRQPG